MLRNNVHESAERVFWSGMVGPDTGKASQYSNVNDGHSHADETSNALEDGANWLQGIDYGYRITGKILKK